MNKDEALRQALEALENNKRTHHYCEDVWYSCPKHEDGCANDAEGDECNCGADKANAEIDATITAIKQALEQPEPEPDREAFERYWKKTRGKKKSDRELNRHPLQPQTYVQDSANRHWVTWQAATKKASPPKPKSLTDEEIEPMFRDRERQKVVGEKDAWYWYAWGISDGESAHGIKGDA